jgi:hypothetical protein
MAEVERAVLVLSGMGEREGDATHSIRNMEGDFDVDMVRPPFTSPCRTTFDFDRSGAAAG